MSSNFCTNVIYNFLKAKRFFEIPDFRQYAIADGIYRVLFPSKTGIMPNLDRKEVEGQLPLPFAVHLFKNLGKVLKNYQ